MLVASVHGTREPGRRAASPASERGGVDDREGPRVVHRSHADPGVSGKRGEFIDTAFSPAEVSPTAISPASGTSSDRAASASRPADPNLTSVITRASGESGSGSAGWGPMGSVVVIDAVANSDAGPASGALVVLESSAGSAGTSGEASAA